MCTVSFIYKGNQEFVLTSSRDEFPARVANMPATYDVLGAKMVYPKDVLSGGTWIGMSNKKRVVCLLNGGFETHERLPEYRHSRGIVVKDFLATNTIQETVKIYNLNEIEPFTMVIVDWNNEIQLFEFVWDGTQKHFRKLSLIIPHIWSSSTLYTGEMKQLRREWFTDFQQKNELTAMSILDFHQNAGIGDPSIDAMMDRGIVKTISITQVEKKEDAITMKYLDVNADSKSEISLNSAVIVHE
ncbi:NRDE family protein [uncultured Kordia sp.]|uniref:NRDE family protein n=1 Tax=uncultured Kordia sp. TaxID=507699 RepID=UPI00261F858D|nr:NRDE family protein [uncultured Kordia sp.]